MHDLDPFDLDAAILRRSEQDLRAFLGALATRLDSALPGRVTIERRRDGIFSSATHVVRIDLAVEDAIYAIAIALDRSGLRTSRAKVVRGVVLTTSAISPAAWLEEVRGVVARLSGAAGDAADTLGRFL